MKQLLFLLLIFCSFSSMAQKITDLPSATGQGIGGIVPIVQNGITKRINVDSIVKPIKNYADSIKDTLITRINANQAQLSTKQSNLVSGLNLATVNGVSLLTPNNITIAGASSKPLFKSITASAGIATWNYDSSSTVTLINTGIASLNITGSVPTGATGILVFTQGAVNTDSLKYNGAFLNIGRAPNKVSIIGFYKRDNDYIFSIDTTANIIAAAGSFDPDATALFTAASTNISYKNAVNAAIVSLKGITLAAGGTAWSKSVMINGRAGSNLTQQSFNWKDQSKFNYTYNGTFVYSANGTQFNGSNAINTNLRPSRDFTGTTSDISIINVVGGTPATIAGLLFGGLDISISATSLYTSIGGTVFAYALSSGETQVTSPLTGRFITSYLNTSTVNTYRNGTLSDSRAYTPQTPFFAIDLFEGAGNANGTASYFSNARVDVTQVINSKLTVAEAQAIDAVWATYQTALSR